MRRRQFPARPAKPFRTSSLASNIDIVARHTRAGFSHVPEDYVRWHYSFFIRFVAQKGYLLRADDVDAKSELWSNDLTAEGYRFVQYAEDRWLNRLHKREDESTGANFLRKWHDSFKSLPRGTFDWTDDA